MRQRRITGLNSSSNQFKSLEAELQWAYIRDRTRFERITKGGLVSPTKKLAEDMDITI
jgi:hypothetical protein